MDSLVKLVNGVIGLLSKFPHVILALMARLIMGSIFLKSGLLKFKDWDNAISLFENVFTDVPLPPVIGAYLSGYGEVIFGFCLIVGFASRFSALGILGMTLVIEIFVFPEEYILHGMWAVCCLYVIKYGPCVLSADYFVKKQFGNK